MGGDYDRADRADRAPMPAGKGERAGRRRVRGRGLQLNFRRLRSCGGPPQPPPFPLPHPRPLDRLGAGPLSPPSEGAEREERRPTQRRPDIWTTSPEDVPAEISFSFSRLTSGDDLLILAAYRVRSHLINARSGVNRTEMKLYGSRAAAGDLIKNGGSLGRPLRYSSVTAPLRGCSLLTPRGRPKSLAAPSAPIYETASRTCAVQEAARGRVILIQPRKKRLESHLCVFHFGAGFV